MSIAGFKSKNHPQQVKARGADDGIDERITPPELFVELNIEHQFTLDAAANEKNAKCEKFFTLENSGLENSWRGETVWVNPPYSSCKEWVAKAIYEVHDECKKVVMLLPANRCEQGWWQDLIEPHRDNGSFITTKFIRGRRRFGWPEGRMVPKKGDRPPFGLVVVTFKKRGKK